MVLGYLLPPSSIEGVSIPKLQDARTHLIWIDGTHTKLHWGSDTLVHTVIACRQRVFENRAGMHRHADIGQFNMTRSRLRAGMCV